MPRLHWASSRAEVWERSATWTLRISGYKKYQRNVRCSLCKYLMTKYLSAEALNKHFPRLGLEKNKERPKVAAK
eukprot:1669495-Karenia_brevis.AAC.1